jgi:hypothetical protein
MLTILLLLVGVVAFTSSSEVVVTGGKAAPSLVPTNDLIQEFANVKTAIMNKLLQLEANIQTNLVCNCENASRPTIINFDYQIFHNIPEPQGKWFCFYICCCHPLRGNWLLTLSFFLSRLDIGLLWTLSTSNDCWWIKKIDTALFIENYGWCTRKTRLSTVSGCNRSNWYSQFEYTEECSSKIWRCMMVSNSRCFIWFFTDIKSESK